MSVNIWKYDDYKTLLRDLIDASNHRGHTKELAAAADCQSSYFSQVLHGKPHLNSDQALGVARHLNFSENETDYFLLLIDHARAGSSALKRRLGDKITVIRKKNKAIEAQLDRSDKIDDQFAAEYYSSWTFVAVHIATSLDFLKTAADIADYLSLPISVVEGNLTILERSGHVRRQAGQWVHGGGEVHLANRSALISLHHGNWRARAVLDAQKREAGGLHFTGVYSASEDAIEKLRESLLEFMKAANKTIGPSKPESLICLNCDLFDLR